MKPILILLLMAAPATAAGWDLDNLTLRQRNSLIIMRDDWNNGYRGRPPCKTNCRTGLDWNSWYWVNPNVATSRPSQATSAGGYQFARPSKEPYSGGPVIILNPYVSKAEGGGGA